jgi:ribose/xylose/arabinose/galactoside ABC-type transport system permease subunit
VVMGLVIVAAVTIDVWRKRKSKVG